MASIAKPPEELPSFQMKSLCAFRQRFPTTMRSHVTNIFLDTVRAGATTPGMVVVSVAATVIGRLQRAHREDNMADVSKFSRMQRLLEDHAEEASAFADWAMAWEAMPQAEKDAQKVLREKAYQRRFMASREATAKQLSCLQALGYSGPIESRLHASRLIAAIRQGGSSDVG
jgi:hypothetical protein